MKYFLDFLFQSPFIFVLTFYFRFDCDCVVIEHEPQRLFNLSWMTN